MWTRLEKINPGVDGPTPATDRNDYVHGAATWRYGRSFPRKEGLPTPVGERKHGRNPIPLSEPTNSEWNQPRGKAKDVGGDRDGQQGLTALRAPIIQNAEGASLLQAWDKEAFEQQTAQVGDVVEYITTLLGEGTQPIQKQVEDPQGQEKKGFTTPNIGLGMDPDPISPQQCSEHESPLGWPYSPGSPCQVYTSPTRDRMERGGGSPGELAPTPMRSQHTCRFGPDYALRDYMQGYRADKPQMSTWPYSPLSGSRVPLHSTV